MITGDFIDARTVIEQLPDLYWAAEKIEGPEGKFFVLGNHDHWRDAKIVKEMMAASGFIT